MVTGVVEDLHGVVWRADVTDVGRGLRDKMRSAHQPTILVETSAPHKIVAANAAWCSLCGYTGSQAINANPKILQGALTDQAKAKRFREALVRSGVASCLLVNYKKSGAPFCHRIRSVRHQAGEGTYYLTSSNEVTDAATRHAMLGAEVTDMEAPTASTAPTRVVVSIFLALTLGLGVVGIRHMIAMMSLSFDASDVPEASPRTVPVFGSHLPRDNTCTVFNRAPCFYESGIHHLDPYVPIPSTFLDPMALLLDPLISQMG